MCDVEFDMVVRRSNILSDALRRMERVTFDPTHMLNVSVYAHYITCFGCSVTGLCNTAFMGS